MIFYGKNLNTISIFTNLFTELSSIFKYKKLKSFAFHRFMIVVNDLSFLLKLIE